MKTFPTSITERALRILKMVVEIYIRDGQPVSSKAILEEAPIALSSATVRSIMADLEEKGYLRSPHTSAGRVPTALGYRLFIDYLLTVQPLKDEQLWNIKQQLNSAVDANTLVGNASALLSNLTRFAGVITKPRHERQTLRHIEFLPISKQQVLVVIVLNGREVQNKIITTNKVYSARELQEASNYLMQTFVGQDLIKIHQQILEALQNDRQSVACYVSVLAEMADKAFAVDNTNDFIMTGEIQLLNIAEEAGMERLRQLFEAIARKQDMLDLLEQCLDSNRLQIFIGEESGCETFGTCSVITAPYRQEGKSIGVLGVIGPTRMPYNHVISVVNATAQLLSAALSEQVSTIAN